MTTRARAKRATAGKERVSDGSDPTHYLKIWNPEEGASTRVGAAWEKSDGHISIRLDRGTVLDWHDYVDGGPYKLTLWPAD